MGYSDAYGAFEQTLQQVTELSGSIAGKVADDATADGSILFARMGIQARSLKKILPDVDRPVQDVDISSCASIARNLIEIFLVIQYLWIEKVTPNVQRFRVLLWRYHQRVEEIRVINCQRIAQGKDPYDEMARTQDARIVLQADPEFLQLSDKRRSQLLKDPVPNARGQQAIAFSAGIPAAKFDAEYKLLSSLSHPNGVGVRVMSATTLADNEWQIWFAQIVWIAQTYLALAASRVREQIPERI